MTLTLTILRCPDHVPPETRRIAGGELRIGRGPDNDWVMPDPDRTLSKRHCVVAFRNGGWALADTSTNGTFVNRESEPVGSGQIRVLNDGDRLRFGAYELEVRIAPTAGLPAARGGPAARSPFDDPFGDDVFATPPPASNSFTTSAFGNDPLFGGPSPAQGVALPPHYDPLRAPAGDESFFAASTVPDHTPSFSDAFRPPPVAQVVIPDDDWDLSLPADPPAPAMQAPSLAAPVQSDRPPASPFAPPGGVDHEPSASPFGSAPASPFAEAAPVVRVAPPAAPAPVAAPADLLSAFLQGARMDMAQPPAQPVTTMIEMGAAFRATVAGIRQALIARSAIKGEFRIEQTMVRARGNNPLKFSADDDDALAALLGLGRRMDVSAAAAIADALRDMRLHELASMAAMQEAVRALIGRLDPVRLRAEGEQIAGLSVLPAQKKARAFEAYEKLYVEIIRALSDDFDSVFGKAFARAYETALRDISAREPQ
jgi:type VI secretion system protein ImpI/type VI secretion system protein